MLLDFYIVAFTHRNLDVASIGKLHIEPDHQADRLGALKAEMGLSELMFLSTCNRVEFLFCTSYEPSDNWLERFFHALYPDKAMTEVEHLSQSAQLFRGIGAVEHLLQVASSIDSMIVGEREIITQVRSAFETCKKHNLTGDFIRLVMRHTIETAKRVYTETSIATKPVSVVALAYHTLRNLNASLDSRVIMIGAGVTNGNMARFLRKHGFKKFTVFNRTLAKAQDLAKELNGNALPLEAMNTFNEGFDILITCTGSAHHLLTPEIYDQLLQGDSNTKIVIDLAIPQDIDPEITAKHALTYISIEQLQKISDQNLRERSKEITHVEEILRDAIFEFQYIERLRKVEIAMREVPQKVKEIRSNAINQVFKNDVDSLPEESRVILERVIGYMEKKYMSMPMKMAKEILLNQEV